MNKNIDLREILKDCPKGTELYSTIHGKVYLVNIYPDESYPIAVSTYRENTIYVFTKEGLFVDFYNGECTIFPSKEQRDWSKFKCSKQKFDPNILKPFDKVIVKRFSEQDVWRANLVSMSKGDYTLLSVMDGEYYEMIIPYNDDTKHLIGTKDQAPEYYRYWED